MTILSSNPQLAPFVLTEGNGQISRENIIVTQTGDEVKSGTLLTKVDTATSGSSAATAGNTGNPTIGAIVVGALGIPGEYNVTFTAATKFDVEDPNGVKIGSGTTGVAFSKKGVTFTVTAGGTPAVSGDSLTVTVAAGSGKYIPYVAAGAQGSADGVLYSHLPAKTGDSDAVGFVRDCEVIRGALIGLDATAEADLLKKGVVVRGTVGLMSTDN